MEQQDTYNNQCDRNPNKFLSTSLPVFTPSQSMIPVYNLDYRVPFFRPHNVSLHNEPALENRIALPCNIGHLKHQDHYVSSNQNKSTFPPLLDNIDEEYILKYLCPPKTALKDGTFNIWFENWIASKGYKIPTPNSKSTNVEVHSKNNNIFTIKTLILLFFKIHKISSKLKRCKILLESIKNIKQLMEKNILTMNETEWKKACSDLFSIKVINQIRITKKKKNYHLIVFYRNNWIL